MNPTRFDLYTNVHKGLRKALFETGYAIGRTDADNDAEFAALTDQCREVFHFLDEHGVNEDRYLLALLESKETGAAQHNLDEHHEIDAMVRRLEEELNRLNTLPQGERAPALRAFYAQYNDFLSRYLLHMEVEETVVTRRFHELCTDEELAESTQQILRNTPPEDMRMMLTHIIPALSTPERLHLVQGVQRLASPEAAAGVLALAQQVLRPQEWEALERGLN